MVRLNMALCGMTMWNKNKASTNVELTPTTTTDQGTGSPDCLRPTRIRPADEEMANAGFERPLASRPGCILRVIPAIARPRSGIRCADLGRVRTRVVGRVSVSDLRE